MVQRISGISEFKLIRIIEKLINPLNKKSRGLILGPGDDSAVFTPGPGSEILVTCDSMIEDRHYIKGSISPFDMGRRAMVMNISDIGAMGGTPLHAFVSLGLNPSTPVADVEEIYRGFISQLEPFGASIAGGNITRIDGPSFVDITLIGEVEKKHIIVRSNAGPGDAVMVTGFPGQAAAGCRILIDRNPESKPECKALVDSYLRPEHRAKEGKALAESGLITSMIDISDGFTGDLGHICEKSGAGADIYQAMLPRSDSLELAARYYNIDVFELILGASDDYELIFTCPPENSLKAVTLLSEFDCPVSKVGVIASPGDEMTIVMEDGSRKKLHPSGWDHFSI